MKIQTIEITNYKAFLGNYLARGFQIIREETEIEEMPDADDPVWSTPAYYQSLRERI